MPGEAVTDSGSEADAKVVEQLTRYQGTTLSHTLSVLSKTTGLVIYKPVFPRVSFRELYRI